MRNIVLCLSISGMLIGCGQPGPSGPRGDKGEPGIKGEKGDSGQVTPALTALSPGVVFGGRTILLQISGSGTHFGDKSTVTFSDPEITVTKIEAGSVANLRVAVSIGTAVRLGAHDVTVTTAGVGGSDEKVTLKGGLRVEASLLAAATGNSKDVPQGGIADVSFLNLDQLNGLSTPVESTAGVLLFRNINVSPYRIDGMGFVDPLAPAGKIGIAFTGQDFRGGPISYISDPKDAHAPTVSARTPTALTPGTALMGQLIAEARQTNLYKVTSAADDQVMQITFGSVGGSLLSAGIVGGVAPQSGRFRDGHGILPSQSGNTATAFSYLDKKGDYYLVATSDNLMGGAMNYGYNLTVKLAAPKKLALKEPAAGDSAAAPVADITTLDGTYVGVDGAIESASDMDYIRFKAMQDGRVYVQATSTGRRFLPTVQFFQQNCTTTIVGSGIRSASQEMGMTSGTTYCVRVSAPAGTPLPLAYTFIISPGLP